MVTAAVKLYLYERWIMSGGTTGCVGSEIPRKVRQQASPAARALCLVVKAQQRTGLRTGDGSQPTASRERMCTRARSGWEGGL